jgi:hypothetical protein
LPRKRKQDNGNPACLEAAASKTRKKAVQHDEVSSRMIAKNLIWCRLEKFESEIHLAEVSNGDKAGRGDKWVSVQSPKFVETPDPYTDNRYFEFAIRN